ncbi:MAG: hypothetical protein J6R00_03080 [Lentisphaeria bacterium]|nr:hypothetical protein [Lentisphaeria bacterium]MBO7153411.1 hypothetical protein [Lentisphaeria bacterium]
MKKLMLFAAACAAGLVLTGCLSTHTSDATAEVKVCVKAPAFTADVQAGQTAVTGKANIHCLFGIICWGVSSYADNAFVSTTANAFGKFPFQLFAPPQTVVKQAATYNACAANKADVILAAKYKLDIADFFVYKKFACQVTGYPGTIKGVTK